VKGCSVIRSIIENDLYKFTMGQLVHFLFPTVQVRYRFINRGLTSFPEGFDDKLRDEIYAIGDKVMSPKERGFLEQNCPFLNSTYLDFLCNLQLNPGQVKIEQNDGLLSISVEGLWDTAIYWEVPLMATISELYFKMIGGIKYGREIRKNRNIYKAETLREAGVRFMEFGLRRRYSSEVEDEVLEDMLTVSNLKLVGTSNVFLAMKYGLKPMGTMAHELIMAESALRGLRYANRYAMEDWTRIYRGDLGIVLTDTFGSHAFFRDFDAAFAKQFDGVRHDSGDPFKFAEMTNKHYESMGINPTTKTIVFSDGLNVSKVLSIHDFSKNIGVSDAYGIGTSFTNDVGIKPLNIVIKLATVNGIQVVKLSDERGKETGCPDAISAAKWTHSHGYCVYCENAIDGVKLKISDIGWRNASGDICDECAKKLRKISPDEIVIK